MSLSPIKQTRGRYFLDHLKFFFHQINLDSYSRAQFYFFPLCQLEAQCYCPLDLGEESPITLDSIALGGRVLITIPLEPRRTCFQLAYDPVTGDTQQQGRGDSSWS